MRALDEYIDMYELIRTELGRDGARDLIASHADYDPDFFSVARREGKVVGVAVRWQTNDPLDVVENGGHTGFETRNGRYIYWPFVYISPEFRHNGVLSELILRSVESCPGAERLSFHRRPTDDGARPGGLHIIGLRRLLNLYVGTESNANHRRRQPADDPIGSGPQRQNPDQGHGSASSPPGRIEDLSTTGAEAHG